VLVCSVTHSRGLSERDERNNRAREEAGAGDVPVRDGYRVSLPPFSVCLLETSEDEQLLS